MSSEVRPLTRAWTPGGRRPAGRGVAVAGVCGGLALLGVLGDGLLPAENRLGPTDYMWFAALLLYPAVGAVIVHHSPRHRIGWVYLAIGVCITLAPVLEGAAVLLDPAPIAEAAATVSQMLFGLAWALLTTAAILLFPDGRLPSRRWVPVAVLGGTATAFVIAGGLVSGLLETLGLTLLALTTLLALASLVVRWRSSTGLMRRQLSWLLLAALVVVVTIAVGTVSHVSGGPYAVSVLMESVAIASFPLATGIAVVRDRLFDIEVVVNRSLVYLTFVAVILAVFVLTVLLTGRLVGDAEGQGTALFAAAVAVVFLAPLKDRMVRAVDSRLYGERSRPYSVLAGVAARLEGTTQLDELVHTAGVAVAEDLRLPFVEVLEEGEHADPEGRAETFPLRHGGRQEGVLVAGLRRGQTAFSARERELLSDVARHLAVAVRARRLSLETEHSRERIVRAREEERLRIRRDLHDGVGPTLAAVGLQLDALGDRLDPDDAEAAATVSLIKSELAHAMADVRRSVEGLRPPALDQAGLRGVVLQRAELLSSAGLTVTVECAEALEIGSAAVEVAAYRIVTEALNNVVRHAGATACRVSIDVRDERVLIEVRDDGVGLAADRIDGVGMRSMADRAGELGGELVVVSGADGTGTSVRATIPVPEDR